MLLNRVLRLALATVPSRRHLSSGITVPSILLVMAPPIKYGLGYKFQTRTLNPNLNPNPKTDLTLKVKIMYAVQNETKIKYIGRPKLAQK